jgi:hypothetical protein
MDFEGAPAEAAQAALNAALRAAGRPPRGRGGYNTQSAWRLVAMAAAELAANIDQPAEALLAQSARGFVAVKGAGRTRPEWWAEDFEGYFEKGRESGPGPAKAPPELERLSREAADLAKRFELESDPAERTRLTNERRRNAAERTRLKRQIQETASA